MTTWQEAARGIPVWLHAQVHVRRRGWSLYPCPVEFVNEDGIGLYTDIVTPRDVVPALDDNDTQVAYLRRLAVALGCPEDVAARGVVAVTYSDRATLTLYAGPEAGRVHDPLFGWVRPVPLPHVADRLTALALAWPADKRVSS